MSRPALYTYFRNKEAIFRAFASAYRDQCLGKAREALEKDNSLVDGITGGLEAAFLQPYRMLSELPHGVELIGINKEIAGDLHHEWLSGMEAILAVRLARESREGMIELGGAQPTTLARMLVSAVDGIKTRHDDVDEISKEIMLLVETIVRALKVKP